MFQTKIDGLTRSGMYFTSKELEMKWKVKRKEVVDAIKYIETNKPVNEEETVEFLKLMKHNKYSVIEQLKTPYKDTPDASYPEF